MSVKIAGYTFEGPYFFASSLENRSGVYAILCGDSPPPVDVGESATVRNRVENHDRKACWKRNCSGTIKYAALYVRGEQQRKKIEQEIRNRYTVPCGEE